MGYDNNAEAKFGWKSNTTGLFLKKHVFNISIVAENGSIIHQKENLTNREAEVSGLEKLTNYTFIIQSKNKYTYSKKFEHKFLTYGNTYGISNFIYLFIYFFLFFIYTINNNNNNNNNNGIYFESN